MQVDVTSSVGRMTPPLSIVLSGYGKHTFPRPSPPLQLLRVDLTTREGRSFQINRGVFEYRLIRIWDANFAHHSPEILKSQK